MKKSILAVLAGSLLWTLMWFGANSVMLVVMPTQFDPNGVSDNPSILGLIITYSFIFSLLAGYLTALFAPRKIFAHTLALGILQLCMGIAAQVAYWDLMPVWYHLTFLSLLIPGNLMGGRLQQFRVLHRAQA